MVLPRLHMVVLVATLLVVFFTRDINSSGSLIIPPQSIGIQPDTPGAGYPYGSNDPYPGASQPPASFQGNVPSTDDQSEHAVRGATPFKAVNIPPPGGNFVRGKDRPVLKKDYFPGKEDIPERNNPVPAVDRTLPLKPILTPLNAYSPPDDGKSERRQRLYEPFIGEGYKDAGPPGFSPGHNAPDIDGTHRNFPPKKTISPSITAADFHPQVQNRGTPIYTDDRKPVVSKRPVKDIGIPEKANVGFSPSSSQPSPHDYPPSAPDYHGHPKHGISDSSVNSKPNIFAHVDSPKPPNKGGDIFGKSNSIYSSPFPFQKDLKIGQDFLLQPPIAFNTQEVFQPRRAIKPPARNGLLEGFSTDFDDFVPQTRTLSKQEKSPIGNIGPQSQRGQDYKEPVADFPVRGAPPGYASTQPYRTPAARSHYDIPYGGHTGSYQCFQYSFPAEAYRLSSVAKSYPQNAIQKEINTKQYLAPLVGLEAQEVAFNPFAFDTPISSRFDYGGLNFRDQQKPADKYSYLKNVKSYPGNFKESNFVGDYPSTMQPLNSACPAEQHNLKSFFYHGGDCYVINPAFQDITYHRCTRRDCNFCGVNRGLSACVEIYRWTTVLAYCTKLKEMSRIVPLRLLLPVGCTCQHYAC